MIELDGSEGEGGGQILRTALGLAASTGQAFRIEGIRANRSRPGLAAQHLAAVQCVGKLCDARMEGAHLGSQTLVFEPCKAPSGDHVVHVGTAGSATLVLQAGLLASARAEGRVRLEVQGGTDVPSSPPASYYRLVLVPLLCRMGLDLKMDLVQRGFYPEGGGVVVATVSAPPSVDPLDLRARGSLREVDGVAFSRNLPEHVARRMASECRRRLVDVPDRQDRTGPGRWSIDRGRGGASRSVRERIGRCILPWRERRQRREGGRACRPGIEGRARCLAGRPCGRSIAALHGVGIRPFPLHRARGQRPPAHPDVHRGLFLAGELRGERRRTRVRERAA